MSMEKLLIFERSWSMSNHQRARLPRIPITPTAVCNNGSQIRNFDIQNNTISTTVTSISSSSVDHLFSNSEIVLNNNSERIMSTFGSNELNNISNLTEQERSIVFGVLNRDQILRQNDAARIK